MTLDTPTPPSPLDGSRRALLEEFRGVFPPETVEEVLADSLARLQPARVDSYLPLLAGRFARERLWAASRPREAVRPTPERPALVLVVCGANSGRSQLAAALLERHGRGLVEAVSAGTAPASSVQPEVATVLSEMGVDAERLYPKPVAPEVVTAADVVVTMGCSDRLLLAERAQRHLDWPVDDPAGQPLEGVRRIRDEIAGHVGELLAHLTGEPESAPRR